MTQRLTKMEIDRVDLVDAGANAKRFALFKRDPGDEAGLIARIAKGVADFLHLQEPIAKAMTFAQIVAGREMSDALEEHWTTLQDALWNAIYAYDDDNQPLAVESKKALVAQNLDEFKAFLLERMDQGVTKSDGPADVRLFQAFVAKVGKKVSAARLARLNEAADALGAVLAEVAADDESAETQKRATPQEETDVDKAELEGVLKSQLAPIAERLDKLEKGEPEKPAEPVTKGDGEEDDEVPEGIAKAFTALADRLEKIETQRGVRTSAAAEEATPVAKRTGQWGGLL